MFKRLTQTVFKFTLTATCLFLLAGVSANAKTGRARYNQCSQLYSPFDRGNNIELARRLSMTPEKQAAQAYNELLKGDIDSHNGEAKIKALINVYEKINPSFPKKQFLAWLEKTNPLEPLFSNSEKSAPPLKVGEVAEKLFYEYFPFLKKADKIPFKEKMSRMTEMMDRSFQSLLSRTKSEKKIDPQQVESFLAQATRGFKEATFGGCLTKSDALFKNMLSSAVTGILMFGLHGAQNPPQRVEDFPWEFFINGLVWSVIFDRVACPKILAREHKFGSEFVESEQKKVFVGNPAVRVFEAVKRTGATIKNRLVQGVVPFLPYYVAGDATAAMGEWYMDRKFRNVTADKKANEDYAFDWGFFNVWDLTYTIPKRVLLLDSEIFTKGFPALQESAERLFRSGMAAKVIRYGAEYATKISQAEYLHFDVFLDVKAVYDDVLPKIKEPVHAVILLPKKFFSEQAAPEQSVEAKP